MVDKCFNKDIYFDRAFKEAVEEFINFPMKPSVSHYLAEFLDSLLDKFSLRSQKYNDAEIENYLEKAINLFASLKDKDIFLGIYSANFSRRLLFDTVANTENEQTVIAKLKIT